MQQLTGKVQLPQGSSIAVNIGFDFDGASVWMESFGQTSQAYMSRGEYGAQVGVPRILKLLDKYGLKASFCIPGHTADTHPGICREIIAAGHEVLHHGYVHEDPTLLPIEQEEAILVKGFEALAKLGVRPIGYRSPGFDMGPNTLALLEKYSIKYDTSLMANDYYPYRPRYCEVNFDRGNVYGEPSGIVELPVSWYLDDFPHLEFTGTRTGMKAPSTVYEIWASHFDYAVDNKLENACMVLTTHPQVIGRPHAITMLERLINHMLERGAWITTCGEIYSGTVF